MKKIILFAVSVGLILFSACGASPKVGYKNTLADMSQVSEGTFNVTLQYRFDEVPENIHFSSTQGSYVLSGAFSRKDKRAKLSVSMLSAPGTEEYEDSISFIVDGDSLYLPLSELSESETLLMYNLTGMNLDFGGIFRNSQYIRIDMRQELGLDFWSGFMGLHTTSLSDMTDNLNTIYQEGAVGKAVYTKDDGKYTMSLDTEALLNLYFAIADELSDNVDTYSKNLLTFISENKSILNEPANHFINSFLAVFSENFSSSLADRLLSRLTELYGSPDGALIALNTSEEGIRDLIAISFDGLFIEDNFTEMDIFETYTEGKIRETVLALAELLGNTDAMNGSSINGTVSYNLNTYCLERTFLSSTAAADLTVELQSGSVSVATPDYFIDYDQLIENLYVFVQDYIVEMLIATWISTPAS